MFEVLLACGHSPTAYDVGRAARKGRTKIFKLLIDAFIKENGPPDISTSSWAGMGINAERSGDLKSPLPLPFLRCHDWKTPPRIPGKSMGLQV